MSYAIATLWDESLDGSELNTTDNVVGLMGKCARSLGDKTHGKVRARFIKVKALVGAQALADLLKTSPQLSSNDELSDANGLYSDKRYAFDIVNDTYRFRLLVMDLKPVYPIKLTFDEGVFEEMRKSSLESRRCANEASSLSVVSDDALMATFSEAISTKKVRYLLQKLCQDDTKSRER